MSINLRGHTHRHDFTRMLTIEVNQIKPYAAQTIQETGITKTYQMN